MWIGVYFVGVVILFVGMVVFPKSRMVPRRLGTWDVAGWMSAAAFVVGLGLMLWSLVKLMTINAGAVML